MARPIEYFFTTQSPWSYLGHAEFMQIAAHHAVAVSYRPVNLLEVFAETGGLPLPKRHPARQRYRILELQRWAAKRMVPMNIHPRFWPFNPALADTVVIAADATGAAVGGLVARMFAGVFEREENLADDATLAAILVETGFAPEAILSAARSAGSAATYAHNSAMAHRLGAIGAPTYVREGEIFWGQDRLGLLDDALSSGRPPYTPDP